MKKINYDKSAEAAIDRAMKSLEEKYGVSFDKIIDVTRMIADNPYWKNICFKALRQKEDFERKNGCTLEDMSFAMQERLECIEKELITAIMYIEWTKEVLIENKIGWISVEKSMPKESDSVFKKFKGTNKWCNGMFEKFSETVNVSVKFSDGTRKTYPSHTVDGKWVDLPEEGNPVVTHWKELPEFIEK